LVTLEGKQISRPEVKNVQQDEVYDYHMMMMQILSDILRWIMDKQVRETLIGLCNFFDIISRKSISLKKLTRLREEIIVILCELEIYF
jgi:RimJ/RimL family protein N-acetyltransferase